MESELIKMLEVVTHCFGLELILAALYEDCDIGYRVHAKQNLHKQECRRRSASGSMHSSHYKACSGIHPIIQQNLFTYTKI